VIPERHVGSFFETSAEEKAALFRLLEWCRNDLSARYAPAGFNLGINDGAAAGQTVMHLHIHLIPRYAGDKPDPRGGVRWIFPEKADYWSGR
jgi:diadenosine tetraphosphate (Ap4A) HIT family hydrolase